MAFPVSPSANDEYTVGSKKYKFNGIAWDKSEIPASIGIAVDAAEDGNTYGRKDGSWVDVSVESTVKAIVTGPTDVSEGTSATYIITNYDSSVVYSVSTVCGSASISGSVITFTADAVDIDTAGKITLIAMLAGKVPTTTEVFITVKVIATVADQALVYDAVSMSEFTALVNVDVDTAINSTAISTANIMSGAGSDSLSTTVKVFKGDRLNVDGVDMLVDSVSVEYAGDDVEMVTNGDFTSGTLGWEIPTNGNIFMSATDGICTFSCNSSSSIYAGQQLSLTVGKGYTVSGDILVNNGYSDKTGIRVVNDILVYDANSSLVEGSYFEPVTDGVWCSFNFMFTATATSQFLQVKNASTNSSVLVRNISVQPLSLYTVSTADVTNGLTPASAYVNSHRAVSNAITQYPADADFNGLTGIESKFAFNSVSEASVADELRTSIRIVDGDKLLVVKADGSKEEITAASVSLVEGTYRFDTTVATAGEVPSKTYNVSGSSVSFRVSGDDFIESPITNYTSVIDDANVLTVTNTHSDIVYDVGSNTLETKVTICNSNDIMIRLTATIMKEG